MKLKVRSISPLSHLHRIDTNTTQQGWGMAEATCSILGCDPNKDFPSDSVGELNANCSAKIMEIDGKNEAPVGERCEIWVQAPKYSSLSAHTHSQRTDLLKQLHERLLEETLRYSRNVCRRPRRPDANRRHRLRRHRRPLLHRRLHEGAYQSKKQPSCDHGTRSTLIRAPEFAGCVCGWCDNTRRGGPESLCCAEGRGESGWRGGEGEVGGRVSRHKRLSGGVVIVDAVPKNPVSLIPGD
jgi:hypothetical protein